jgi:hypothetical protein
MVPTVEFGGQCLWFNPEGDRSWFPYPYWVCRLKDWWCAEGSCHTYGSTSTMTYISPDHWIPQLPTPIPQDAGVTHKWGGLGPGVCFCSWNPDFRAATNWHFHTNSHFSNAQWGAFGQMTFSFFRFHRNYPTIPHNSPQTPHSPTNTSPQKITDLHPCSPTANRHPPTSTSTDPSGLYSSIMAVIVDVARRGLEIHHCRPPTLNCWVRGPAVMLLRGRTTASQIATVRVVGEMVIIVDDRPSQPRNTSLPTPDPQLESEVQLWCILRGRTTASQIATVHVLEESRWGGDWTAFALISIKQYNWLL